MEIMGAWGKEPFDNDDALDFVDALEHHPTWVDVKVELKQAIASKDYLEAPDGSQAVAGAALVASCLGKRSFLPENYDDLIGKLGAVPTDMRELARAAVVRVRGPNSELAELWRENEEEFSGWLKTLDEIQSALEGKA